MNAIASPKLYDGPDGKKYTHNEIRGKHHPKIGEPYLDTGDKVCFAKHGGPYPYRPILRLATPEEMKGAEPHAGSEKKMCPCCGCATVSIHKPCCGWVRAYNNYIMRPPEHAALGLEDYADAHWRDFLPKQVHAGVRLSPESVGKRFKAKGGWVATCLNRNEDGSYVCLHSSGLITHKADGSIETAGFEDFWLISEWDEKAEAGVTPEGAATPNACTAKKAASAPPAQPAILPTWTDGDVRAELVRLKLFEKNGPFLEPAKMRHALHAFQVQIRILEAGRSEAENAIKAAAERGEEVANDRRTEHVPVAKTWRGLGIAK